MGSAGLYLAYAGIGKAVTGHDAYFFLNEALVGSNEKVAAYCTAFVLLSGARE